MLGLDPIGAKITLWRCCLFVMARLVRATCRGTVLVQVARTSRAMTWRGQNPVRQRSILALMGLDPRICGCVHRVNSSRFSSIGIWFFFFNDTATTEIYTISLHDALPISGPPV